MKHIRTLVSTYHHIYFDHIYKEQNWTADLLSKRGIDKAPGKFFFSAYEQGAMTNMGSINFLRARRHDGISFLTM